MRIPAQITFRHMEPSPAIERAIRDKVAWLERFYGDIMTCRIVFETPHRHGRKGYLYHCRIDVTVPGDELVVGRGPDQRAAHADPYVAIRDAFRAARRELQDYARRRRRQVKSHVGPPHAVVTRLVPRRSCGFLMTRDGREIYFHRHSVIGDFDRLWLGAEVRYSEEMGDKGPQASSVTPVGKSGHRAG